MMREDEGDKDRTRLLLLTGVNRERENKKKEMVRIRMNNFNSTKDIVITIGKEKGERRLRQSVEVVMTVRCIGMILLRSYARN